MHQQLALLDRPLPRSRPAARGPWAVDPRTREVGRRGLAQARAALRATSTRLAA